MYRNDPPGTTRPPAPQVAPWQQTAAPGGQAPWQPVPAVDPLAQQQQTGMQYAQNPVLPQMPMMPAMDLPPMPGMFDAQGYNHPMGDAGFRGQGQPMPPPQAPPQQAPAPPMPPPTYLPDMRDTMAMTTEAPNPMLGGGIGAPPSLPPSPDFSGMMGGLMGSPPQQPMPSLPPAMPPQTNEGPWADRGGLPPWAHVVEPAVSGWLSTERSTPPGPPSGWQPDGGGGQPSQPMAGHEGPPPMQQQPRMGAPPPPMMPPMQMPMGPPQSPPPMQMPYPPANEPMSIYDWQRGEEQQRRDNMRPGNPERMALDENAERRAREEQAGTRTVTPGVTPPSLPPAPTPGSAPSPAPWMGSGAAAGMEAGRQQALGPLAIGAMDAYYRGNAGLEGAGAQAMANSGLGWAGLGSRFGQLGDQYNLGQQGNLLGLLAGLRI